VITSDCKGVTDKSKHPIQTPLLLVAPIKHGKIYILTWQLKDGIAGPEKMSIARQRPVNMFLYQQYYDHLQAITCITYHSLLGSGVLKQSVPRLYNEDTSQITGGGVTVLKAPRAIRK
jgi:hypothetical protein